MESTATECTTRSGGDAARTEGVRSALDGPGTEPKSHGAMPAASQPRARTPKKPATSALGVLCACAPRVALNTKGTRGPLINIHIEPRPGPRR